MVENPFGVVSDCTIDAPRLVQVICKAHPRRTLGIICSLRNNAYTNPTLQNVMCYDQAATYIINSPTWGTSNSLLRTSCFTTSLTKSKPIKCTCAVGEKLDREKPFNDPIAETALNIVEAVTQILRSES